MILWIFLLSVSLSLSLSLEKFAFFLLQPIHKQCLAVVVEDGDWVLVPIILLRLLINRLTKAEEGEAGAMVPLMPVVHVLLPSLTFRRIFRHCLQYYSQESKLFNTIAKSTILSSNMPIGLLSKLGVAQSLFICPWRYYALSLLLFVVKKGFYSWL